MSYRVGIVKEREPGGYAQVVTKRKTVCGECYHQKTFCYGCLFSPKIVGRVSNPIGAEVGDTVKIYLSTKKLFMAAGMFYLLPVFTLFVGVLLGTYVSETIKVSKTASTILGAGVGVSIGIILVTVWGRINNIIEILQPVITSIEITAELK